MPLYAQHVALTNESVREKLAAEGNSRFIIEPVPGFDIGKELEANMEAYMTWCVMGAVAFYRAGKAIPLPKTILDETRRAAKDKKELLHDFIEEHLQYCRESFIGSDEIREAFCGMSGLSVASLEATDSSAIFGLLKEWLDSSESPEGRTILIPMVKRTKKQYPSRKGGAQQVRGYANLAWRPSQRLAEVVNGIRAQYRDRDVKLYPDLSGEAVNAA